MKTQALLLALACAVATSGAAAAHNSSHTIVDLAVATPDLSTLVTAVKAAGLVDTLSGPGPLTVFAPTNEAFAALPKGTLDNLLKPENKQQLVDILTYHVAAGEFKQADMMDMGSVQTVEGKNVTVRVVGKDVFLNSAKITAADNKASNGIVHIIDEVLMPSNAPPTPVPAPLPSIPALATADKDLSTLVAALKAADLVDTLSGKGPFTVFAPTNEAFAALPKGTLDNLLKPENKQQLVDILTYHVAAADVHKADLMDMGMLQTVEGKNVTVRVADGGVLINSAKVTSADNDASNGVVHIIDAVLMPPTPAPTPLPSILDIADSDEDLIFFSTLVKSAGLTKALSGPGPFTVLAPTNDAFSLLNPNGLLDPANAKVLQKILGFHVIQGSYPPHALAAGNVSSLEGDPLEVLVRSGAGDYQLGGAYVGSPRSNALDVRNTLKLTGYNSATDTMRHVFHVGRPALNASNGVVYFVPGVLMPPNTTAPAVPRPAGAFSGCTEKSCIFELVNTKTGCCGQVDAAPRIPPSLFNDTKALAEYILLTEQLSLVFRGNLINQACRVVPSYRPNGTKSIDWFQGFEPWCQARCGCGGHLKPCKDVADDPATHTYCSLCGPKYNQPIDVQFFHNNNVDCASGAM